MSETQSNNQKNPSKINKKKLTAIIILSAILLCFAALFVYSGSYDKTYPNTFVDDVSVSGLSYDDLLGKCEEISGSYKLPKDIKISLKDEAVSVPSSDFDIQFDSQKTAQTAFGSRRDQGFYKNAIEYLKSFFTKREITTSVRYNKKELDLLISDLAEKYEKEPLDASYEAQNDTLIINNGHGGIKVNKSALEENLGRYLKNPKDALELTFSAIKGKPFDLDTLFEELSAPPVNASYAKNEEGEAIIIPDKPQVFIDKEKLREALSKNAESVSLDAKIIPAEITKEYLEKEMFSGVMGRWTSYFSASNYSRSANVALAASRIDGVVLLPGESFSYDKTVGPRTAENGFKLAGVYINNKVEQGIGGGICQTSSTLYSAALYANLEIVERTSHSLPVSYMPPGQDATIAAGAIDFVFKNNTNHPIKISATIKGGSITCEITGTPVKGQKVSVNNTITSVFEPKTQIEEDETVPVGYKKTTNGEKGYAVSSTRTVYLNNKEISRQNLTKSLYHATPHIISVNPLDKDTPPENLTELSAPASTTPSEEEMEGEDDRESEEEEIVEV